MSDADDWRVKKSDGSILWYDPAGTHQLADVFDTSGNLEAEYYYLGGLLIASRAHFYYSDRLETVRVMTDVTGNVQFESDFYPFGGEVVVSGSQNTDTQNKLIGRRRDTDLSTAFDYAHLRMYNSAMGRWLQTDPADADPTDPQSLNRYNYVGNSPTNFADPTGGDKVVATFTFSITAWGSAFGPPSIYEGSVGQFGDPFGGLGRYPIFQIERRGAVRRPAKAARNNSSWLKAYAKSLFSWKNFSAGFKQGGCFRQFAEEAFDPAANLAGQDAAIKAAAQSGAYVTATAYAAHEGLTVPMRSSIVRGILDIGEVAGEAIGLGLTIYDEGKALTNEVKSFQSGECQ